MIIALDYDNTYTRDPKFWNTFLELAKKADHKVISCSMRNLGEEAEEVYAALKGKVSDFYFTNRMAKSAFLLDLGIKPDIWIDDSPAWIFNNG